MKKSILFGFLFFTATFLKAQSMAKDSLAAVDSSVKASIKTPRDSMLAILFSKAIYPVIKSSKFSGVVPVSNVDEKVDTTLHYKLVMEVTTPVTDSSAGEINGALGEVGRLINIHVASGVPKKNIDVVVVAHGSILYALYNESTYKKKYKISNPNTAVFNELLNAGVKFIACGQAMALFNVKKEEMFPAVKVALSAQSTLTNYQLKGYIYKNIERE